VLHLAGPRWGPVCVPLEGARLLEGSVDLPYRGPEGPVVVFYEMASSSSTEDLDRRLESYRLQGGSTLWLLESQSASRCPG
jgi:hypothetical protein